MVLIAGYVSASILPKTGTNIVQRQNEVPLTFGAAQWIWTGEEGTPGGTVPDLVSRGFRKHIINPSASDLPICLTLAVAADNEYDLYVNGFNIGNNYERFENASAFHDADIYNVPLYAGDENIIALNVTNGIKEGSAFNPAGVIVTGVIEFSSGLQQVLASNSSWITLAAETPANFFQATFNDAAWIPASEQGTDGGSLWGVTTIVPNNVIGCHNF